MPAYKRFGKEDLSHRIEAFITYLHQQGLTSFYHFPANYYGRQVFVIEQGQELAQVIFGSQGGIYLTARGGSLKVLLLAWIKQEQPRYHEWPNTAIPYGSGEVDDSESARITFGQGDGDAVIPCAIRMTASDHPLVDLAERLGYQVYFTHAGAYRYRIASPAGNARLGHDLAETFASLLKEDLYA